jgi:hypothetical protein
MTAEQIRATHVCNWSDEILREIAAQLAEMNVSLTRLAQAPPPYPRHTNDEKEVRP